jgi:carboxymethylenebutenolidase
MAHQVADVDSEQLRARVIKPEGRCRAGVLVLSHWQGIDERTDECGHMLADEGFATLAWDPFSAYDRDLPLPERRRLTQGVIQDADARREQTHWVGYMQQELGVEQVGGIGFCMGGRMGLLLGVTDQRLRCFSAFYPTVRMPVPQGVINVIEAAPEIHCAVQVHYPGKDEATSVDTFRALRAGLESRPGKVPTLCHYYPEAVHGFMNPEHQSNSANSEATALGWATAVAFLKACLLSQRPA